MDAALQRLQGQATCTVVLHDTGHLGALGMLAAQLAEVGMLGLVVQNGPPIMALPGVTLPGGFGGFIYALNPALAAGGGFAAHLRQWIGTYHAAGPDMRYPGEHAASCEIERERDGVLLPQAVLDELDKLATALNLAPLGIMNPGKILPGDLRQAAGGLG